MSGLGQVGKFSKRAGHPQEPGCSFGDIAIGPAGQVFEVCTKDKEGTRPDDARRSAPPPIPTGWGRTASRAARVIGDDQRAAVRSDPAAAAPHGRRRDRAGVGHRTRPVRTSAASTCMWTDEQPNESSDTDIWLRSSDDAGVTWSTPARVNDVTTNAQFLPRIALDPTTGNLAFGWHDARNDAGDTVRATPTARPNTDAMYYVTFSTDGGATFAPSVAASQACRTPRTRRTASTSATTAAWRSSAASRCPRGPTTRTARATTPAGALKTFDIYTARVSPV